MRSSSSIDARTSSSATSAWSRSGASGSMPAAGRPLRPLDLGLDELAYAGGD